MKFLEPVTQDLFLKVTILKSMIYAGVLWGLYRKGWAMTQDQDDFIFPFWLNAQQAQHYAAQHWPQYQARRISSENFYTALLPTLRRLNIRPTLYRSHQQRLKLSVVQMQSWFFDDLSAKSV